MADKKITQLDELTSVSSSDLMLVIDDPAGTPVSKKATIQNVVNAGASGVYCRWRGSGSSTPDSPQEGDIWNDTTSGNIIKIYANSDWRVLN
ncbi:MAG: hypothetical protein A2Y25_12085 [Candidatus Melainabacteria bacterium GWF2_37_15]|nr:MAG: hypothetical protein A2Y25_12085 [Candidatus Melainabacteria bacterium GWF2_37_15]